VASFDWILSVLNPWVLAGVVIFLAFSAVKGLIVLRPTQTTACALARRVLSYGQILGVLLILVGLTLAIYRLLQGLWWFSVLSWWAGVFVLGVLLLALGGRLLRGAGVTLAREPLKVFALPSRFFVREIRPDLASASQGLARNHIICIDGTWNDPDCKTNVHRLYKSLPPDGKTQIARYYSGVGVSTNEGVAIEFFGEKVSKTFIACATGLGATPIRWQAYCDFVQAYQPGDRIFIFGFSRGAAIARMLANDIDTFGIPELVQAKYHKRRHKDPKLQALFVSNKKCGAVEIEMLGLWDTVAAFGVPWNKIELFKKLIIPANVKKAYHLVAIDEVRKAFDITLINHEDRIEEIWFAGAHTNVGGGFEGDGKLSDITLRFMMKRACEHGIKFASDAFDQLHPSADGKFWLASQWWGLFPPLRGRTQRKVHVEPVQAGIRPRVHKSVIERKEMTKNYKPEERYNPENVNFLNRSYELDDRD
jgi:hypothetical protein